MLFRFSPWGWSTGVTYLRGFTFCICEEGQIIKDLRCIDPKQCPVGYGVGRLNFDSTRQTSALCTQCAKGETYKDTSGNGTCKGCSRCGAGAHQSKACTNSQNTKCALCTFKTSLMQALAHLATPNPRNATSERISMVAAATALGNAYLARTQRSISGILLTARSLEIK